MKNIVISPRLWRTFLRGSVSLVCLAASAVAAPGGGVAVGGTGSPFSGNAVSVAAGSGTPSVGVSSGGGHNSGAVADGGRRSVSVSNGGLPANSYNAQLGGSGVRTGTGLTNAQSGGLVPATGFSSRAAAGTAYANGPGFSSPTAVGHAGDLRLPTNNVGSTANNNAGFTMSRSFDGGVHTGELRVSRSPATGPQTLQIRNAWTEPNNPHVAPAARASRGGYNSAYDEDRSALQNRVVNGQHLYPGAAGYSALNPGRADTGHRINRAADGDRRHPRDIYNRFYFTSLVYPYFYSSFFPLYGGYFGGSYGFADVTGFGSNALDDPAYNTPINGNVTNTYNNPFGNEGDGDQNSTNQSVPPTDDNSLPLNQPPAVGPQNPATTEERGSSETGPDTIVESVQSELAKRGYYGGKVDSMYNDATRAALKRFQGDRQLAVTGRINEATLHALQLD